jgi:hypothetical protein
VTALRILSSALPSWNGSAFGRNLTSCYEDFYYCSQL